ncbi:hypothetical protein L2E82_15906 [Cichorium intybus]|uniref:Uncharacterized protein n=1 Tax=Cichorium intybus TaxID=13427 RepID=A0ACB9F4N5_CICIN|nr:hypothetical protein L2E82_15906 [Cichorium intybus]
MGRCKNVGYFFPLNSFQIGDLQSYLSDLTLFLAPESKTFYILVDNRPWVEDLVSKPAHIWQLMVTKSRMSPFAITKGKKGGKDDPGFNELNYSRTPSSHAKKLKRWLSMSTLSKKRVLLPVKKLRNSLLENSKLHRTLYGFIVFEVVWRDVRGVNYLNELQTDTSLAIEAKYMRRWEFDSIAQAAEGITVWLPGTPYERLLLERHLHSMIGEAFHDAGTDTPSTCTSSEDENISKISVLSEEDNPCSPSSIHTDQSEKLEHQTNITNTPPPDINIDENPYPEKSEDQTNISNTPLSDIDENPCPDKSEDQTNISNTPPPDIDNDTASCQIPSPCPTDCIESTYPDQYRDVLLLFRFNDLHLPFELRKIIMSDLRLLTLLEAGLPSWVIFFQSYPVFCHIYRPWMCPLARALYVAISFVTVVIGFYDLYKNVPLLKATASRLFGPLFDWIETWEMVSRIKYLGTMLFLHNAEKAVMWFLMVTRTIRSLVSVLTQPLVAPFLVLLDVVSPFLNIVIEIGDRLSSLVGILLETSWSLVENLVDVVLLPVWYISSAVSNFATSVMSPIFLCLWGAVYAPIRLILKLSYFLGLIYKYMYDLIGGLWLFISSFLKVASNAEITMKTYEVSMWRALWNDLFSQVFKATKSVLYGVVAFFAACNRHRLSIYNHLREFIQGIYQLVQRSGTRTPSTDLRERKGLPNKSMKQS